MPQLLPRSSFKPSLPAGRPFLFNYDIDIFNHVSAQLPREIIGQAGRVPKNIADMICFFSHHMVAFLNAPGSDSDERQQNRINYADNGDGKPDDVVVRPANVDWNESMDNSKTNARDQNEKTNDNTAHDPSPVGYKSSLPA